MAGNNRYLAGPTNVMRAPIHGNVTVEAGDLMWLYDAGNAATALGGIIAGRAPDYYAYPMSSLSSTCNGLRRTQYIKGESWFLGIAMDGSESGVTEDISVATSGQFRYPMLTTANAVNTSNVTVGMTVSITSRPANQYVQPGGTGQGVSAYCGYCTKTESGASFVDFFLRTDMGPAAIIS